MKWILAFVLAACGGSASTNPATDPATGPANHAAATEAAPYSLAVVVQGWELFMGNDELLPADDPARYPGALGALKSAVTGSTFAKSAPSGSQAMLVTYADKPVVRLPMGPIAKLDAAAFGVQKDYFKKIGNELVAGVELAASELDKVKGGKKFLIVIGDGNDTNNDAAAPRLTKLKAELAAHDIQVVPLVYKTQLSAETSVIGKLAEPQAVGNAELAPKLQAALDGLANRAK